MEWLKTLQNLYRSKSHPICIYAPSAQGGRLLWRSSPPGKDGDGIVLPDSLEEMRRQVSAPQAFEDALKRLENGNPVDVLFALPGFSVGLTPYCENGSCLAVIADIRPESDVYDHLAQTQLMRMMHTVATGFRQQIFRAFNCLPPLLRAMEDQEMYEEMDYLKVLSSSCYQMLRNIYNISDTARLQTGELKETRVDLSVLLGDLCASARMLIKNTGAVLTDKIELQPAFTCLDAERFVAAVINLIDNALLYCTDKSHILVRGYRSGEEYVVSVSDKGVGIPPQLRGKAMDLFTTCDTRGDGVQRLGLGLCVVRAFIRAYGGSYLISSEEDGGTTILMRLPLRDDPEIPLYIEQKNVEYITDKFSKLYVGLANVCEYPLY